MHHRNGENGAARLAWEMFEKTGNISYYMLYQELRMDDRGPKKRSRKGGRGSGDGI